MIQETIYADANATYPVAPAHYDRVVELLKKVDGNPSSIHSRGREAKIALEKARGQVARLLGADPLELVFTSGATEANNLAIRGVVEKARIDGAKTPHVIVSAGEHSSVLEAAKVLASAGLARVSFAPLMREGFVRVEDVLALVEPETVLVCIMHVNNETGAINPVREVADALNQRRPDVHFHVDAVQSFGKLDLSDFRKIPVHSAAISGHKIGAFKGTGALYLRSGRKLAPLISGGGQERARRPGTENMPGIVSFGIRCAEIAQDPSWWSKARDKARAFAELLSAIPGAVIHGPHPASSDAIGNTVNFHIEGVPGDDILLNFDLSGIQASSGSACSSGVGRPSHVLKAMGYDDWQALNSVRVSFAAEGAVEDVLRMGEVLRQVTARVRR